MCKCLILQVGTGVLEYLNVRKSRIIFIASSLDNGKLYEICVTILNLNVFGTLTETFYYTITSPKPCHKNELRRFRAKTLYLHKGT